ncbi:hypothetical protein GCM10023116_16490 [Kistimonas scapharcae]|uniref:Uncharacterized protein n=2 Tax=Kistimonas scapharcae TaxID=1036133 RepID=A0ABP8V238_9GAMM
MDAGKAEDEYKEAARLFRKASAENRCVAIKRMQSWLIQYAFANDVVTRCAWLEKIKIIKSTLDNKFSDLWQLVLIESGFYRGSEVLASPFILRDSLADFCFINTKINDFYPRCAFEDCILHFSRTDIIAKPLYGIDSFSVLGSDYSILVNALHNAIFKDSTREKHHSDEIIDHLRQESGTMPRSRRVRRQKHTGAHTGAAQETTVASSSTFQVEATEEGLSLEKSALRVITKRAGLQATSATWDLCPESVFPEPEDIETAITILFNIMTYRNTKDKTFVYNRPNYKKRLEKCYDLLKSRCDDESLPLTLFGYIHFFLGWMHEEKLIADSSPDEAARFYEKATSKKQFFPLLKHASEIYENIGDFKNAHRCLFLLREAIQDIQNEERAEESVPDSEAAEGIGIPEGTEVKIGKTISYLSSEFQDILETPLCQHSCRLF